MAGLPPGRNVLVIHTECTLAPIIQRTPSPERSWAPPQGRAAQGRRRYGIAGGDPLDWAQATRGGEVLSAPRLLARYRASIVIDGSRIRRLWLSVLLVEAWVVLTGIQALVGEMIVHSSAVTTFDRHVTTVVVAHRTHPSLMLP